MELIAETGSTMTDADVVRAIYAAMGARDFERLFELVDEACTIDQDPALPWGGHYEGHDGFAASALALTGTIDSTVTTLALFEAGGEVLQYGRTAGTVRKTGVAFDVPEVHRWEVRDGKAVSARFAIDSAAMGEALGS